MSFPESFSLLRLRVLADPDPSAVCTVIQRFQNLNIVPRRFSAEFGTDERLHIEIDVCGMSAELLSLVADKISQSPSIHQALWHPLT